MQERSIIESLINGNSLALATLYRKYAERAYWLSFKYLGNKMLAEDAVHDIFLKLWEKRGKIDLDQPIEPFLFTILRNHLIDMLRKHQEELFVIDDNAEVFNLCAQAADDSDIAAGRYEFIRKAYDMLTPSQQQIFHYKLTGKYTNEEIAQRLGCTVSTVKSHYYQVLTKLRQLARDMAFSALLAMPLTGSFLDLL